MRFIMNGINGQYLRNIVENSAKDTDEVLAAVAYATEVDLLFSWCKKNNIPLKYYGRLDEGIAVNVNILNDFLNTKSQNYICKLVQHHHAKVIWWRGVGIYVGSANLTNHAWYKNIEAGCFFEEEEIDDMMESDISDMFNILEEKSTPLTEEVVHEMVKRSEALKKSIPDSKDFWNSPSFHKWSGLIETTAKKASDRKHDVFLKEWHATLQYLRDIGQLLVKNRPSWIDSSAPTGTQVDQFLHAHYYESTFKGQTANYEYFFEKNKSRKAKALNEAIEWWKTLPKAPNKEDIMINEDAPFLQSALSKEALSQMNDRAFHDICTRVHSIKDYARHVSNKSVNLPSDGTRYDIPQKVNALAKRIWNNQSSEGENIKKLLIYILHDGSIEQLPERLWQGVTDPKWKIDGLGISSLGEIVGWALPDKFPPRNGRTSKALKSLGYDVTVHVG